MRDIKSVGTTCTFRVGRIGRKGRRGGGGEVYPKEDLFWHRQITCEEALQNQLKSFLPFEVGLKDCNEEECSGNEKNCMLYVVCSMLYIASAKSRSTRGASHQLALVGSYLTLADCFLGGKKECIITYFHFPYPRKLYVLSPNVFFLK